MQTSYMQLKKITIPQVEKLKGECKFFFFTDQREWNGNGRKAMPWMIKKLNNKTIPHKDFIGSASSKWGCSYQCSHFNPATVLFKKRKRKIIILGQITCWKLNVDFSSLKKRLT